MKKLFLLALMVVSCGAFAQDGKKEYPIARVDLGNDGFAIARMQCVDGYLFMFAVKGTSLQVTQVYTPRQSRMGTQLPPEPVTCQ